MHTVYSITNNLSGAVYVGVTGQELSSRLKCHFVSAMRKTDKELYTDIFNYGALNFTVKTLFTSLDGQMASAMERYWINKYYYQKKKVYNTHKIDLYPKLHVLQVIKDKLKERHICMYDLSKQTGIYTHTLEAILKRRFSISRSDLKQINKALKTKFSVNDLTHLIDE